MLNRNSRRFLNFLRHSVPDFDDQVYTYLFIDEHYPEKLERVFATVRYLEEQGYLKIFVTSSGDHIGVILTETALHPYEFTAVKILSFLFRSVIVPIIVSFVTAVLTLWFLQ